MGVALGEEVTTKVGQGGHPEGDGTCGVGTGVGSVVCVAMHVICVCVCVCVHVCLCMHLWGCGRGKCLGMLMLHETISRVQEFIVPGEEKFLSHYVKLDT